jgi:peroxiredoxin
MRGFTLLLTALVLLSTTACKPKLALDVSSGQQPAPAFSLTDIDGKPLNLADLKGKVVLLDFWATWCAVCKVEIPHFIDMQNKYGPKGLQIVGLSLDDSANTVHEFASKMGMNYPIALADDRLATQYGGILGLPVAFVIDRNGNIVKKFVGETKPEVFEHEIIKLL